MQCLENKCDYSQEKKYSIFSRPTSVVHGLRPQQYDFNDPTKKGTSKEAEKRMQHIHIQQICPQY